MCKISVVSFIYFEHGVDLVYGLVVVRARGDDVLAGVEAGRVAADHQQRGGQGAPHQHLGVLAERVLDQSEVGIWSRDLPSTNHSLPWPYSCPGARGTAAGRPPRRLDQSAVSNLDNV